MVMRATVISASLRTTQPNPANGTNQIEVPAKNTPKKTNAPVKLPNCAARIPATTNGGQKFNPVKNPSIATPATPLFAAVDSSVSTLPILTSFGPAHAPVHFRFA